MRSFILLFALAAVSLAAVAIYPIKSGDRLELDFGKNIKRWERVRDGKEEYILQCAANDKAAHCSKFVLKDGKVGSPETVAKVLSNGQLVIEKIAKHDSGSYSSPDQIVSPNVAGSLINVIVD